MFCRLLISLVSCGLLLDHCVATIQADDHQFFERQVRPLLVKRCFECHGGTKAAGGLSLASGSGWAMGGDNGPAIVPGEPDETKIETARDFDNNWNEAVEAVWRKVLGHVINLMTRKY